MAHAGEVHAGMRLDAVTRDRADDRACRVWCDSRRLCRSVAVGDDGLRCSASERCPGTDSRMPEQGHRVPALVSGILASEKIGLPVCRKPGHRRWGVAKLAFWPSASAQSALTAQRLRQWEQRVS